MRRRGYEDGEHKGPRRAAGSCVRFEGEPRQPQRAAHGLEIARREKASRSGADLPAGSAFNSCHSYTSCRPMRRSTPPTTGDYGRPFVRRASGRGKTSSPTSSPGKKPEGGIANPAEFGRRCEIMLNLQSLARLGLILLLASACVSSDSAADDTTTSRQRVSPVRLGTMRRWRSAAAFDDREGASEKISSVRSAKRSPRSRRMSNIAARNTAGSAGAGSLRWAGVRREKLAWFVKLKSILGAETVATKCANVRGEVRPKKNARKHRAIDA